MDAKVTLSFNATIVEKAKQYAQEQGISLSRLTEILLRKLTSGQYKSFEDFPVANWVNMISEGEAQYFTKSKSNKEIKSEYFKSKKKK
ncbi:MAG: DUF6364 family protein [Bacteroidia bacterium]|jgi:hypothetical protein